MAAGAVGARISNVTAVAIKESKNLKLKFNFIIKSSKHSDVIYYGSSPGFMYNYSL